MMDAAADDLNARPGKRATRTGGRPATQGVIPGRYALSVGNPDRPTPEGWHWTALADVARLETGHTPSRKHPEYWDGDVPWVGIRDATGNHGRTLMDTAQHTNELGLANSSARLLPADTVCLSRTASVGYVVVMGRPMATSQDFVNWICSDRLDFRFLKYVLLAEHDTFLTFASGTTHQTIYFPEVKAFHVCLPSIGVQRRIVEVLSAYDELIENNTRRIQILEEMAQAIYREWFVEFRYPGFEDLQLVDSDLGPIPSGWEPVQMGHVMSEFYDGPHATPEPSEDGAIYLGIKNLTERGGLDLTEVRHIAEEDYPRWTRRVEPAPGDMVFTYEASLHRYAIIPPGFRGTLGRRIALLRHNDDVVDRQFLFNMFLSREWRAVVEQRVNVGSTVDRIPLKEFPAFPMLLPPRSLQAAYGSIATPMHRLIETLRSSTTTLRDMRDRLLPRLISGEIDVSDLDIDVGDAAA